MKRRAIDRPLPHEDWLALARGEDLDLVTDPRDARRANEHERKLAPVVAGGKAVQLAPICITAHIYIEPAQAALFGLHVAGDEDEPRTRC